MAKLCIDCAHFQRSIGIITDNNCLAPQNFEEPAINLVTGHRSNKRRWSLCDTHREDGWFGARMSKTCGAEGRWFKKKEDK